MVPNIEFQTFDYTGRKKTSPPKEEVKVQRKVGETEAEEQEEEEEMEMLNLAQRFVRMRSTSQSTLIQACCISVQYSTVQCSTVQLNEGQST